MDRTAIPLALIALPAIALDETVFSLLARAQYLNGYDSAKATSRIILGDDRAALLFDFPRRLADLSLHLPGPLSDPAALATTATCLPFFTRFRNRLVEERAIQKMCSRSVAALKDDLGLRASAAGPLSMVKACRDCMAEDTAKHGVAYWHRVHQLPGVTVCPVHRAPLVQSTPVKQGKQPTLFLPHDLRWACAVSQKRNVGTNDCSLSLAELAAAALSQPLPGGFSAEALYHTYRHGLKAAGFLSQGNRLRLASLQHYLDAYVARLPASVRLCRPELSRETHALVDILRARTRTFNTLPHLVLIDVLFGSWSHFISTYEWECAMCRDANPLHSSPTDRSSEIAYSGRPYTLRDQSSWDRCSATILGYVREHPDCTRSQLIKACGGPWRWLYRHDGSWLDANAPRPLPRRRSYATWVNWAKRDAALVELIERENLAWKFSRTSRITSQTILRTLGQVPFSVQLGKMPKSAARLADIAEQIRHQRR
jgi:hypothetical protein